MTLDDVVSELILTQGVIEHVATVILTEMRALGDVIKESKATGANDDGDQTSDPNGKKTRKTGTKSTTGKTGLPGMLVGGAINKIIAAAEKLVSILAPATNGPKSRESSKTGTAGAMAGAAGIPELAVFQAALGGSVEAINQIVGAAEKFVAALSPAAMMQLDQAERNLHATIGQALLPVISNFAGFLEKASSALDGPMKQLAPIIDKVSSALAGEFAAIVEVIAAILEGMMPILDGLASLFQMNADIMRVFYSLIEVLAKQFGTLFGGMDGVIKEVVGLFKQLALGLMAMLASTLLFIGAEETLGSLIATLERVRPPVKNDAMREAGIKTFEQISKDMATSSVMAGGIGPKTQDEFFKEMVELLKQIRDKKENSEFNQRMDRGQKRLVQGIEARGNRIATGFATGGIAGGIVGAFRFD